MVRKNYNLQHILYVKFRNPNLKIKNSFECEGTLHKLIKVQF